MKSTFADTLKRPRFSFQYSLSIDTVALDFRYKTSFKAAIMIFSTGMAMHYLGEERRLTFASM
jgi:hypothetical protein